MARYKFTRFLYVALLLALLNPSWVRAQGNDFPGPGFPGFGDAGGSGGPVNFPTNGGQFNWGGVKWGPITVWDAHRGDTIVFTYNIRYWRFAIMVSTPMISSGSNMRLSDPYRDGPRWIHPLDNPVNGISEMTFCNVCEFRVEAGDDFPTLWIAYYGNSDWDAELQVQYVIPAPQPPPRNPVTQAKKDAARAKASKQNTWSINLGLLATGVCGAVPWEVCMAIGLMSGAFGLDAQRLNDIANDPPDGNYQYPYDPVFNWYVVPWFTLLPEDGSAGPWGMAPYINNYMYYATMVDGMNDAAYVSANRFTGAWQAGDFGAEDMQYWRTVWSLQASGSYYAEVASEMWAFQWFFRNNWDPWTDLGSGPGYLSDIIGEMAQSYSELAWEFQQ